MGLENWDTITSIISNVASAINALVVAIVVIVGLTTWRRQMIGTKSYETVRELLLLAHRFHAAFGHSRGAPTWSDEYVGRPRGENETLAQAQVLDAKFARLNRLQPAVDLLPKLEQARWEVEIVTGEELGPVVSSFGKVVRELHIAILQHFGTQFEAADTPPESGQRAIARNFDRTELIYQAGEDELTKCADNALAELEKRLKKYIKR
jgi:NifB/MoaA-like Fe-S oxidoreductase